MLTFEQIKELVELVAHHRLAAVEIERSGFRLRVDAQCGAAAGALPPAAAAPPAVAAPPVAAPEAALAAVPPAPAAPPAPSGHVLTSPIVGTFYRSPSPDAPSFVEIGTRVKRGQVLCIVEAMKLMNEIESDADGVIAQVFPQNAQPVEFGEPLFEITPG